MVGMVLRKHDNPGGSIGGSVLTIGDSPGEGGAVVGGISKQAGGYRVDTSGRIPDLDGITDETLAGAWAKVCARVGQGDLVLRV